MGASPWQIALVLVLAVLLFGGGGRISSIMGDMAKGLKAFRSGLKEEDEAHKSIAQPGDDAVNVTPEKETEKTGS